MSLYRLRAVITCRHHALTIARSDRGLFRPIGAQLRTGTLSSSSQIQLSSIILILYSSPVKQKTGAKTGLFFGLFLGFFNKTRQKQAKPPASVSNFSERQGASTAPKRLARRPWLVVGALDPCFVST